MKCTLCKGRKGKRWCPAQRAPICAQCCGEKRMIEIDCPESCQYLAAGRAREIEQEHVRYLRAADVHERERYFRAIAAHERVLAHLQLLIGEARRRARDLTDGDVLEALDLLLATLRTEESGLLYERTSSNLRVEGMRRRLAEALEYHRRPAEAGRDRLALKDAIECLEVIRSFAARRAASPASQAFVDFLARTAPRVGREADPDSRIIVPGQTI
jgi:hypothetical protein